MWCQYGKLTNETCINTLNCVLGVDIAVTSKLLMMKVWDKKCCTENHGNLLKSFKGPI